MSKRDELLQKLDTFADLKDDWDSYGAGPIDPIAIDIARWFLKQRLADDCLVTASVVPTVDCGVAVEWREMDRTVTWEVLGNG